MNKKTAILKAIKQTLNEDVEILGGPVVDRIYEGAEIDNPDGVTNMSLIEGIGLVAAVITILKEAYELLIALKTKHSSKGNELTSELSRVVEEISNRTPKFGELPSEEKSIALEAAKKSLEAIFYET